MVKYIAILTLALACNASAFIRLGTNTFTSAYVGTQAVQTVRLGTNLVWQRSEFSPTNIAGLKVWIKPETLAGLTNGQAVFGWDDSSGLGNGFTQTTAYIHNPKYYTNINGGYGAVFFTNGAIGYVADSRKMTLSQPTFSGVSQPDTIIIVFKPMTFALQGAPVEKDFGIIDSTETTKRQIIGAIGAFGPNTVGQYASTWGNSNAVTLMSTVYYTAIFDGANSATSTNGINFVSGVNPGTNTLGKILIGQLFNYLGPNFYLSEMLVYDSAITGAIRTNLNNYIKTKYGL